MQKKIENKWFEKLEIKVNNKLVEESKSLTTNDNNVTSDVFLKKQIHSSVDERYQEVRTK